MHVATVALPEPRLFDDTERVAAKAVTAPNVTTPATAGIRNRLAPHRLVRGLRPAACAPMPS